MEIQSKINEYKHVKNTLEVEIKDLETKIIISEERLRQLNEQLDNEYGTHDEMKLLDIKNDLLNQVKELEDHLNTKDS